MAITTLRPNSDISIDPKWTRYSGSGTWYESVNDAILSANGIYADATTVGENMFATVVLGFQDLASIPDDEYVYKLSFWGFVTTQSGWGNGLPVYMSLRNTTGSIDGWTPDAGYPVETGAMDVFWIGNFGSGLGKQVDKIFDESQSPSLAAINSLEIEVTAGPGFFSVHGQYSAVHQIEVYVETRPRRIQQAIV